MPSINIEVVKEQAFMGVPSKLPNICDIYPLTIKEIITMGTDVYGQRLGLLLMEEADLHNLLKEKNIESIPIEDIHILSYLLKCADQDQMFSLELHKAFSTFIKEDILFLPKIDSILIGPPSERRLINESNYPLFQEILRIQNKRAIKEPPPENESEIARKFRLKREQRDAAKRKQQQKNGEEQSLIELLEIAEVFNIDYKNTTLLAFYNLLHRHQMKEKWDNDIRMICAGADAKKIKTKYWGESSKE